MKRRDVISTTHISEAKGAFDSLIKPLELSEYVVVSSDIWDDFRAAARGRGLEFYYSVEDSENEGVEYHVYVNSEDDVDTIEDVLWAVKVLQEYEAGVQQPEVVFSYG